VLASIGERILALPAGVALLFVFLLPALESSAFLGFVFPGEIAVIIGGVLASQGKFPLWVAIAAAVLGAVIGDSVGYEVGRHYGDRILRGSVGKLPIIRKELDKHLATATAFVRRRGPHAVFVGRFTTALRVLVPGLAGMAELPYPQFLLFNVLGALAWGTMFVLLGYFAGAAWERFATDAGHIGLALLVLVLVGLIATSLFRRARAEGHLTAAAMAELRFARWFRGRYPRLSAWLALRVDQFSSRGFVLSVAVTGAALLLWIYGALIQDVVWNDDAALRDPGITAWVVAHRTAALTDVMTAVSHIGSAAVLIPVVIVCGVLLGWKRRTLRPLLQLGVVFVAAWGVAAITKELIDRARPPAQDWLVPAAGPSFPSQHAAASAAVFGMLVVLLWPGRGRGARAGVLSAAALLALAVSASRIYLGVHWSTDVFAGSVLGAGLVVVAAASSLWARGPDGRTLERATDASRQPAAGPNARNGSGS
jgi:membrane protein DedA with SNARE-associated domain/membrane-associated phospholipid phosphatase